MKLATGWQDQGVSMLELPPAYQVVKRIPEDLPLVVRPGRKKIALLYGAIWLVPVLLCGAPLGVLIGAGGEPLLGLLVLPLVLVLGLPYIAFLFYTATSGGPMLAASEHGVWIRSRKWPAKAIWLPWAAVEQVYLRRWGFDKALCVKPRDPRTGGGQGVFASMDQGMQKMLFGAGFTATIVFGDRPQAEILAAVAHFAHGRTWVNLPAPRG